MSFDLESLPTLNPINGFEFHLTIPKLTLKKGEDSLASLLKKGLKLPDLELLGSQEVFATIWLGHSTEFIYLYFDIEEPFQETFYPDYKRGDSIELFLDTRKSNKESVMSRYSHHFLYLPVAVEGVQFLEITRFRGHEVRPFIEIDDFQANVTIEKNGYSVFFKIKKTTLVGFTPKDILGFAYRINRCKKKPQEFPLNTYEQSFEQHPATWAFLDLEE